MNKCRNCKSDFIPKQGSTGIFCKQSCAAIYNNKLRGKKPRKPAAERRFIRAWGPHTKIKSCNVCKSFFERVRHATVCSDRCYIASKHKCANGTKGLKYKGMSFDSHWEIILATYMDENNIEWIQPDSLAWVDSTGKHRKYFPDFYLPQLDVYLDPKNPLVENNQAEKLAYIKQHYSNVYWGSPDYLKSVIMTA